ncbi:Neuronal acetylcholine receptor subunit alpha-4 [Frankliniella fusca]|uniref:Neuronal acetylcholine receptor subunit alpha-4 n=1 Tax=Frankliniella fusca TaxID=407009 RepID=A0AAE1HA30_9NEOP|nr:Neuronal acetylcholine receptor subunit alpha-4 [Frankliniella fusca]
MSPAPYIGDCPPRQREDWERTERASLMAGYRKSSAHCHEVDVIMVPLRIQVDTDLLLSTMDVEIFLEWEDPYLPEAESRVVLNASEVWVPEIVSVGLTDHVLSPTSVVGVLETMPGSRSVRSYHETELRGACSPHATGAWPHDQVHCAFLIQPSAGQFFNLSHDMSIADAIQLHKDIIARSPLERLSSWEVQLIDSKLFISSGILVEVVLRRLPAQLEAEVVHPLLAVSALVPASTALPPGSGQRPALLVVALLLHAVLLVSLPHFVGDLEGDATPRTRTCSRPQQAEMRRASREIEGETALNFVLAYRDFGALLVAVILLWLLSLRLASRTRPLSGWARATARSLSVLRTPLLLPAAASAPAPAPAPLPARRPPDGQSVELSEIIDRLTFLAVSASYLGLVITGLQ